MKYKTMKNNCIRVSYNSMGEPVKEKISFTKQKYPSRIRAPPDSDLTLRPQASNGAKTHLPSSAPDFHDSTRAVHVLREILFGKVVRDIIEPCSSVRPTRLTTLPDILRFFCQTSFGATTVAHQRQMDLFHVILAGQGSSSFLRTMKRLLHIPGIKPFKDKIATIYFEVWCWLIQNDALSDDGNCERLLVKMEDMIRCLQSIGSTNGNQFSPELLHDFEHVVRSSAPQDFYLKSEKDIVVEQWVDADDILEKVLVLLEKNDKAIENLEEELLYDLQSSRIADVRTRPGANESHLETPKGVRKNAKSRFDLVQHLLHELLSLDSIRRGVMGKTAFSSILQKWYRASFGIQFISPDVFEHLICHFLVKEEETLIDYVTFAGVILTYFLEEEHGVPDPERIISFIKDDYRGIDKRHLDCIGSYVRQCRLKYTEMNVSNLLSNRERVVNSRRSLSRIRPYGESDFIAKWVVASCSRIEQKRPGHNMKTPHSAIKSDRTRIQREQTPLHLVEPNSSMSSSEARSNHSVPFPKTKQVENRKKKIGIEEVKENIGCTNIYFRFPDLEPFRTPVGDIRSYGPRVESEVANCSLSHSLKEYSHPSLSDPEDPNLGLHKAAENNDGVFESSTAGNCPTEGTLQTCGANDTLMGKLVDISMQNRTKDVNIQNTVCETPTECQYDPNRRSLPDVISQHVPSKCITEEPVSETSVASYEVKNVNKSEQRSSIEIIPSKKRRRQSTKTSEPRCKRKDQMLVPLPSQETRMVLTSCLDVVYSTGNEDLPDVISNSSNKNHGSLFSPWQITSFIRVALLNKYTCMPEPQARIPRDLFHNRPFIIPRMSKAVVAFFCMNMMFHPVFSTKEKGQDRFILSSFHLNTQSQIQCETNRNPNKEVLDISLYHDEEVTNVDEISSKEVNSSTVQKLETPTATSSSTPSMQKNLLELNVGSVGDPTVCIDVAIVNGNEFMQENTLSENITLGRSEAIQIASIFLTKMHDWSAVFLETESKLLDIISFFSVLHRSIEGSFQKKHVYDEKSIPSLSIKGAHNFFTKETKGKKADAMSGGYVGVRSLLLTSRGRKNGRCNQRRKIARLRIRTVEPIKYRIR